MKRAHVPRVGCENHRKTMGKPWENGGLMGFNRI